MSRLSNQPYGLQMRLVVVQQPVCASSNLQCQNNQLLLISQFTSSTFSSELYLNVPHLTYQPSNVIPIQWSFAPETIVRVLEDKIGHLELFAFRVLDLKDGLEKCGHKLF